MAEKLDDAQLKALLANELDAAIDYSESELSPDRVRAIEYYRGEMNDVPHLPGRSSYTSRDVADTVGWMLPGIIRVYTSSDRMGIYEPERPGDEKFCEQATDYANFIFWRDNPGYRILWDATHDSLLHGNGIVKVWWDDSEECEYSEHSGLTDEQVALLLAEEGVELVASSPGEIQQTIVVDQQGGQIQSEVQTFNVKLKRTTTKGRVRIECIAPEDFLLNEDAICIEDARFSAQRRLVTRSDLVEMGFDRELVDGLTTQSILTDSSEEKIARDESWGTALDTAHHSMRTIELYECYLKADADGDGVAETIRAYYAGEHGAGELLDWEVWEDVFPFVDIPCEPVPHRWNARSMFHEVEDIQRVKTVLTRQTLDNLYASNIPQREVEEGTVLNPEALVNPKFGQVILRKSGSNPIVPHVVPFVADKTMLGLQYFDMVREMRTGVSRSTMALDPEALQNQTATSIQAQQSAAYSQIELIARNQAELGWRGVFRAILKLIVKHQDRPRTIRLRDEWVEMDPRHWNAAMDVRINVGLGTGSRERDMAMLMQIMTIQREMGAAMVQTGMPDMALRFAPKIIEAAKKITEAAGIRHPDQFWPDLDEQTVEQIIQQKSQQAQQPDPKVLEARARIELEQHKAQAAMQVKQVELAAERDREAAKAHLERMKIEADGLLKREQISNELQLKREQLQAELDLKWRMFTEELAMKERLGSAEASSKERVATSRVEMGGEPG